MVLDDGLKFFGIVVIVVLVLNAVLFEVAKFLKSRKKNYENPDQPGERRSMIGAVLVYMILVAIDVFFLAWLFTSGRDIISDYLDPDIFNRFS